MDQVNLAAQMTERLEAAGHRLTEPRLHLIKAVAALEQRPFTGEDLYEDLRQTGLGRATVFRTLKLLQEVGILSRLHLADGCQRYVVAPRNQHAHDERHHDRLICRQCGLVTYLENCPMTGSIARIARESGYHVESHHLDMLGLCSSCRSTPDTGNHTSHA